MTDRHIRVGVFAPPHHSNDENPGRWPCNATSSSWSGSTISGTRSTGWASITPAACRSTARRSCSSRRQPSGRRASSWCRRHLPALPQPLMVADRIVQLDHQTSRARHVRLRPRRAVFRCAHAEHPRRQVTRSHAAGGGHHRETDRRRNRDASRPTGIRSRTRAFIWSRTRALARIWQLRASRRRRER